MDEDSPRLWLYNPNTSPLPLPQSSFLYTDSKIYSIQNDEFPNGEVPISDIRKEIAKIDIDGKRLDSKLSEMGQASLDERFPILLLGELANPWTLSNLKLGAIPIFSAVIENLCRVWSDGLDSRYSNPGVHHVTLARSENWCENTYVGFATKIQMKKMFEWLDNGVKGSWKPAKITEGVIRLSNFEVEEIPKSAVTYNGEAEIVDYQIPTIEGSILPLAELFIPLHTRRGSYNNRGKLARVQHFNQRDFHNNLFRKGSSFPFDQVLNIM